MKTNLSLLFYLKKQKNYESGEAPIYLRITVNSKRTEIATGRLCDPKRWNSKSGRISGNKEDRRLPQKKDSEELDKFSNFNVL